MNKSLTTTVPFLPRFSRRPLSVFSKIVATVLLILTIVLVLLAALVAKSMILLTVSVVMFLIACLIGFGVRWAPILGSVICSFSLYAFIAQSSFPLYHLAHPRDALSPWPISYILFVVIVILLWGMLVTLVAGVVAVILNYRQKEPHVPGWFSHAQAATIGLLCGVLLLGMFAPLPTTAATATTTNGEATVHMGISSFLQSSVTVSKGAKLLLVDDGSFEHNLSNGTWSNGQPQPEQPGGAPTVQNRDIKGQSLEIGPFTTAGTYHLYCSLHTGMTLTITVQ